MPMVPPNLRQARRANAAGMTLIEVTIFLVIVAIAMLAALQVYSRHMLGGRLAEQRRRAYQIAEEKLDEMRTFIASRTESNPLDAVWRFYGPVPAATGCDAENATVANRRFCCSLNGRAPSPTGAFPMVSDLPEFPGRNLITVSIINSETPSEANYGIRYSPVVGTAPPAQNFGADINGNGRFFTVGGVPKVATDTTGLAPFPNLNINGNAVYNAGTGQWEHVLNDTNVTAGFSLMPVVVTIHWQGPTGTLERVDVFAILTNKTQ